MWLEQISPVINLLWRGEWSPQFIEAARLLYDHELVVVSKGCFTLQVENQRWQMQRGSFAIIPPNTNHSSFANGERVVRACIHFDWMPGRRKARPPMWQYLPRRPAAGSVVNTPRIVPFKLKVGACRLDGPVGALLESLFLRWSTGETLQHLICRATFLELLLRLLFDDKQPSARQDPAAALAYRAKALLDQNNPNSDVGVIELLASSGYSYNHVARVFRRSFGLSPLAYLNAQKLERAKLLLNDPRLTIAEVAYQSGFRDRGYFTRLFGKETKMTPGQFRREMR